MRTALLIFVAVCLVSCDSTQCPPGGIDSPWTLRDDMMNLGILLVDSKTHAFEGAALVQLEACQGCDSVRIPLTARTLDARLLYWIALIYTATGDTVWFSLEGLDQQGAIFRPDSFDSPSNFSRLDQAHTLEVEAECVFSPSCTLTSHSAALFDTAWSAVSNLDVVHEFGQRPYRVGFLQYIQAARSREIYPDKWVIFLYRGRVTR
jgi:hypothetical protein